MCERRRAGGDRVDELADQPRARRARPARPRGRAGRRTFDHRAAVLAQQRRGCAPRTVAMRRRSAGSGRTWSVRPSASCGVLPSDARCRGRPACVRQQLVVRCRSAHDPAVLQEQHVVGAVEQQRAGGDDHRGAAAGGPAPGARRSGPRCGRRPRSSARPARASRRRCSSARARASRWRCPPEKDRPRSSTSLSSPARQRVEDVVAAGDRQRPRAARRRRWRPRGSSSSRSDPVNSRGSVSLTTTRRRTAVQRQVGRAARRPAAPAVRSRAEPAEPVGQRGGLLGARGDHGGQPAGRDVDAADRVDQRRGPVGRLGSRRAACVAWCRARPAAPG